MKEMKQLAKHNQFVPVIVFFVVAILILISVVMAVRQGAGSTVSRANRDTFLTPGDDALSLQQDLNNLGSDPGAADEAELNSIH